MKCILLTTTLLLLLATHPSLANTTPRPGQQNSNADLLVATTCPTTPNNNLGDYLLQYLTQSTLWLPSESSPGCTTDKLEILKQCQRLYPDKDITNIVEANGKKVNSVCKKVKNKVKCGKVEQGGEVSVVVYRCLESPFQSDALLVPSPCIFDHIHNSSTCLDSKLWNQTAYDSCTKRNFKLKSYAVLLPCGVGLFTGVEFVCCPKEHVDTRIPDLKDDDDEYDDNDSNDDEDEEEDDDYYFDEVTTTTTTTTTTAAPTVDPYFLQKQSYDPLQEHANFKQAEGRLENLHRLRMSKVMRDWEELEKKYQEMVGKKGQEKEAEEFKRTVTLRFQKTIKNLEEEGQAEKRQLVAVHQQRVLQHLSLRKKESMECYTQSLPTQNPNKIRKCLEKLMRILHKDRHHTLTHFKHLAKANPEQAEKEKDYTLQRLTQISQMARQAVGMMDRYPPVASKLRPLIYDYVLSLQGRDDPVGESVLTATHESEKELLDAVLPGEEEEEEQVASSTTTTTTTTMESTVASSTVSSTTQQDLDSSGEDNEEVVDQQEEVKSAGEAAVDHLEQLISVRREYISEPKKPLYLTLAFSTIAFMAAVLVGLAVVVKRRVIDHPRNHGFLAVNQQLTPPQLLKSPEEKHVANMQINGYENPTYKYFEQNG